MLTFPSVPASAREPVNVMVMGENRRQVGEPMRSAPNTRMVRTVSEMVASAKISSLVDGMMISVKLVPEPNEHAVTSTFVLAGSVTVPLLGTVPLAQVDAVSHRFRSAAKCGHSVRVFAAASSGGVGMTGMTAGSPGPFTLYSVAGPASVCMISRRK